MSLLMSLVSSQLTSRACLCDKSFCSRGILHISLSGTGSSLSHKACLIAVDLVLQGLSPVLAWMWVRLMPVVEDLSLPAMLATSATPSHSLDRSWHISPVFGDEDCNDSQYSVLVFIPLSTKMTATTITMRIIRMLKRTMFLHTSSLSCLNIASWIGE